MKNLPRTIENNSRATIGNATATFIAWATGLVAAAASLAYPPSASAEVPCRYEVNHVIQGPSCGFGLMMPTVGTAISPNGRYVVGNWQQCEVGHRAFVYDTTTSQFMLLPLAPGFTSTWAWDVNDSGQIVGEGNGGFVYDLHTGHYTQLEPLPGGAWSAAYGINASGVVCGFRSVGSSNDPVNPQTAFIWSPKDGYTDLGVLIEPGSIALDINASNTVVGYAGLIGSPSQRGLIHQNGHTTIVPPIPEGLWSIVSRVNDNGMMIIYGTVSIEPNILEAYLVDGDTWTMLPALPGFSFPHPRGLSNDGTVVGRSFQPTSKATIWHQGQPADLNSLIPTHTGFALQFAWAIAEDGSIVVEGRDAQSDTVTLVLEPVMPTQGDTDCDASVNMDDLLKVINHWGPCAGCAADLNGDHSVNIQDLMLVITNWTFTK